MCTKISTHDIHGLTYLANGTAHISSLISQTLVASYVRGRSRNPELDKPPTTNRASRFGLGRCPRRRLNALGISQCPIPLAVFVKSDEEYWASTTYMCVVYIMLFIHLLKEVAILPRLPAILCFLNMEKCSNVAHFIFMKIY